MNVAEKSFWRCTVCNDIHYGVAKPALCPTCRTANAYIKVSIEEAKRVMQTERSSPSFTLEEQTAAWNDFCKDNDFKINPNQKIVDYITKGLFENEKRFGLKLCPCRVRDGTFETDLSLICPCNFKTHDTWKAKGRCFCGLFVKQSKEKQIIKKSKL
jgi:ferredoxin-thioredoxin reductase catalytic chain